MSRGGQWNSQLDGSDHAAIPDHQVFAKPTYARVPADGELFEAQEDIVGQLCVEARENAQAVPGQVFNRLKLHQRRKEIAASIEIVDSRAEDVQAETQGEAT